MTTKETLEKIQEMIGGDAFTLRSYPTRTAWLEARRTGLGASDAASVMGISPWKNEEQLWRSKVYGDSDDGGNADTERGHKSEEHIRELYAIEMGCEVIDGTGKIMRSKIHPFMTCTLDGIIVGEKPAILEIKSVRIKGDAWKDDQIPDYYFLQLLHQLAVTGWDEAILLARFCRGEGWDNASERTYHVHRADVEDQIAKLIAKEERFWNHNVLGHIKPSLRMPTI